MPHNFNGEFVVQKSTPKYSIDETIEILNGMLFFLGYGRIKDITIQSDVEIKYSML